MDAPRTNAEGLPGSSLKLVSRAGDGPRDAGGGVAGFMIEISAFIEPVNAATSEFKLLRKSTCLSSALSSASKWSVRVS